MKTKDIPAIVMLLAGAIYCLMGIRYQIPLWDFSIQLLIVLIIFWIIGGIIRFVLDKFMVMMEDKTEEKEGESSEETTEESGDEKSAEGEKASTSEDEE